MKQRTEVKFNNVYEYAANERFSAEQDKPEFVHQ